MDFSEINGLFSSVIISDFKSTVKNHRFLLMLWNASTSIEDVSLYRYVSADRTKPIRCLIGYLICPTDC